MASGATLRRLQKEYASLRNDPIPSATVRPLESNYLHAHILLHGPAFYETPYEGGTYHAVLQFPKNYPLGPPSVIMRTPSGRFKPNTKICMSMSDFHPEDWCPAWSIRTIVLGLVSFMNSNELTTGGMEASARDRIRLAKESWRQCMEGDKLALEIFGDVLRRIREETDSGEDGAWPPPRRAEPEPSPTPPPPPASTARRGTTRRAGVANGDPPKKVAPKQNSGKNAAKNKKRKEREKKRKAGRKFLYQLKEDGPKFLSVIIDGLRKEKFDITEMMADHICYRTETVDDYKELKAALMSLSTEVCELLIESEVGGRPIATFKLGESSAIACPNNDLIIDVLEIPAPKEGRHYQSGLEHVEFVIGGSKAPSSPLNGPDHRKVLENWMECHPDVTWNIKALDKEIDPDVSMKIETEDFGICSVKFHLWPLSRVIDYEKTQLNVANL